MSRRADHGSGTLLIVAAMAVLALCCGSVVVAGGYLVAYRQARTTADAAALSAAMTLSDSCAAARRIATGEGLSLRSCVVTGRPPSFVVAVEVERRVTAPIPGLPQQVRAKAFAGTTDLADG